MPKKLSLSKRLAKFTRTIGIRIREFWSRITGISSPLFGISWNSSDTDFKVAYRVITLLEDRRVLFVSYEPEIESDCIFSVIEIRRFLTHELGNLPPNSKLVPILKAIRAACRKFMERMQLFGALSPYELRRLQDEIYRIESSKQDSKNETNNIFYAGHPSCTTYHLLGELRGVVGIYIAKMAALFNLEIEGELASILPTINPED